MTHRTEERVARLRRARQLTAIAKREAALKEEIEIERAGDAEKTARLRALRLAKEAADKADEDVESVARSEKPA